MTGGGAGVAETQDDATAEWWARWWGEDWSWNGLAAKPLGENGGVIHGGRHGERNLQDYWRRDPTSGLPRDDAALEAAGELLRAPDGALWHVAHVPLAWKTGETAKAGWDTERATLLAEMVAARVAAAAETAVDWTCDAEGPDLRAQLSGAVLLQPPPHPKRGTLPLHLVCDSAWLPGWDARGAAFGPGFRCKTANFSKGASFDSATFSENAGFNSATFSGYASFSNAEFHNGADFEAADFAGRARFAEAIFKGFANFTDTTFAKSVTFESAYLGQPGATAAGSAGARFLRCQFSGPAHFRAAKFPAFMDFTAANFARQAWFTDITWPAAAADWHACFDQAVFRDVASFRDSGFRCFAAFDGATFAGGLQLDDADEGDAKLTFQAELAAALARKGEGEQSLKQLERGCRVLKQAMDKASHKTREQIFHAFELKARRRQHGTPRPERYLAWAYEGVADYGRAIVRPLLLLLISIPLFALFYWWLAGIETLQAYCQALNYSLGRVFPFGAWAVTDRAWETALLGNADHWTFLARGLATAQSIIAAILVFLSLLAVRRRFQIN